MTAPAYVETFIASIPLAKRVEPAKRITLFTEISPSGFTNARVPLAAAVSLTVEPSACSELQRPIGRENGEQSVVHWLRKATITADRG